LLKITRSLAWEANTPYTFLENWTREIREPRPRFDSVSKQLKIFIQESIYL